MKSPIRIGFTGTQKGMSDDQREAFFNFLLTCPKQITEFHHGDCMGADAQAHHIVQIDLYLPIVIHPPLDMSKQAFCQATPRDQVREPREYLTRNKDIVDESDMLVVCPSEFLPKLRSGTWSTQRYASKQGKPFVIIYPDGRMSQPDEEEPF